MAPPVHTGLAPRKLATDMQMTPIVAAVPKAVPVRQETQQFNTKVRTKNSSGRIRLPASDTIMGIVPPARQTVVSIPISTITMRIVRTVFSPRTELCHSSPAGIRRHNP